MLSTTVYDRQVTELRGHSSDRQYRAWSNIDFNYPTGQNENQIENSGCLFIIHGLVSSI
jgi:hypothetical protein